LSFELRFSYLHHTPRQQHAINKFSIISAMKLHKYSH
jgi:hypothetical protein